MTIHLGKGFLRFVGIVLIVTAAVFTTLAMDDTYREVWTAALVGFSFPIGLMLQLDW